MACLVQQSSLCPAELKGLEVVSPCNIWPILPGAHPAQPHPTPLHITSHGLSYFPEVPVVIARQGSLPACQPCSATVVPYTTPAMYMREYFYPTSPHPTSLDVGIIIVPWPINVSAWHGCSSIWQLNDLTWRSKCPERRFHAGWNLWRPCHVLQHDKTWNVGLWVNIDSRLVDRLLW